MADPKYPTGAFEALIADILARGPCDLLVDRKEAHALLDALAAMPLEDRAALARRFNPVEPLTDHARTAALTVAAAECRWCGHVHDPEDGRCDTYTRRCGGRCTCPGEGLIVAYDKINAGLLVAEQDCAELRSQLAEAEAATVQRITEWLRAGRHAIIGPNSAAKRIEEQFGGGPDAVKEPNG